jgi:hypothetical protein
MPTPFPPEFANRLSRESAPEVLPTSRQRFLSGGSVAKNQIDRVYRFRWSCMITGLTQAERNTLMAFIRDHEYTKDITWTIDGVDYIGEFFGKAVPGFQGKRYKVSFTYIAREV